MKFKCRKQMRYNTQPKINKKQQRSKKSFEFIIINKSTPIIQQLNKSNKYLPKQKNIGESIPVPKINIGQNEDQDQYFDMETNKNNVLYEGTKVIQIKGEQVYGIVLRTGYTSFRGGIFRAMLYPKEIQFNFYKNGILFLLTLMLIGLLVYFGMLYKIIEIEIPTLLIILRFFDTATWMIPPALPIFFSICQTISLLRLGYKKILATDAAKIVVAGDVSIMCFDKTGTLTKDTMEIYGYTDFSCNEIKHSLIQNSEKEKLLHKFFGTCHGVYLINGENLGDELDVKMLEFSNYKIVQEQEQQQINYNFKVKKDNSNATLTVHKIWEFESQFQRMACIMSDDEENKLYGIVKGSPEKIFELCDKNNIDHDAFNHMLSVLTNKGLRVIAFGYKELQNKETNRDQLEHNIQFIGLFVLENKLKTDTADVIKRLQNGNILCKVISGDNLLTTLQCAKEANIIPNDTEKIIACNSLKDCYIQSLPSEKKDILQILTDTKLARQYKLGITGRFLEEIQDYFNNNFGLQEKNILINLLTQTFVFSRCKPKQKAEIIHMFQVHLQEKIGMIGDGANDCSAIKQADIGISFTKTDASYSSPFSYSETSLDCTLKILAEGRCTLSNMIECYRYYLTASVIKYTIACILILEYSNMSTFQVVFINYFVNIPLLLILSLSKPLEDLTPYRSISNMLDIENFFSVYGQVIICIGQFLTQYFYLRGQDWFVPLDAIEDSSEYNQKGCAMSFVFSILAYYISYPSKQKIYQNKTLTLALFIIFVYLVLLYIIPKSVGGPSLFNTNEVVEDRTKFLGIQLLISLIFGLAMVIYEEKIVKKYLGPHRKNTLNQIRKTQSLSN